MTPHERSQRTALLRKQGTPRPPTSNPHAPVRCLLRVSIYHVSFLRGLFPDNMFSAATMNNLGEPARACVRATLHVSTCSMCSTGHHGHMHASARQLCMAVHGVQGI